MDEKEIFRDTEDFYLKNTENQVHSLLIDFAVEHAGGTILDLGCATGDYCIELQKHGFKCTGADINEKYVKRAQEKGIEAHVMDAMNLEFPDNSFDTILLFEVLEHLENPGSVLSEANRVARKNILITVPNVTNFKKLKSYGLTYEHMLDKDHVNFFTKSDLESLLSRIFKEYKVDERELIRLGIIELPWWLSYPLLVLYKLNIVKSFVYYRLYAVALVN